MDNIYEGPVEYQIKDVPDDTKETKDPLWKKALLVTVGACSEYAITMLFKCVSPVVPKTFIKKFAFKFGVIAIAEATSIVVTRVIRREVDEIEKEVKTLKFNIEKAASDPEEKPAQA